MIKNLKIELTDGSIYTLRSRDELTEIDASKEALFLFDNGEVYKGYTDGHVDEDEDFCLSQKDSPFSCGLPYNRLVGWCYKKTIKDKS